MEPYKIVIDIKPVCYASSKKLAFKAFLSAVMEGLNNKTIGTFQQLETTCWIEEGEKYLCDFYTARDQAIELGWFLNGKWVE
jgi:hypothetical protein